MTRLHRHVGSSLLLGLVVCGSARAQLVSPFPIQTATPTLIQQQLATPLAPGMKTPVPTGAAGAATLSVQEEAKLASDDLFRNTSTGLTTPTRLGYGSGQVQAALPLQPQFSIPLLQWQARPEDAALRLGNFYLDVRALEATLLVSDNVNQTELNRQWGSISAVRLEMALIYQITEQVRLAAGARVVWLPFRGQIGFEDPLADFEVSIVPQALFQLTYTIPVAGWDFNLFEQFLIRQGGIGTGRSFDLIGRNAETIEDRAGRYAFSERQGQSTSTRRFQRGIEYHNVVGFNSSHLLPTQTRATFGFTHDDTWYSQNPLALPSSQNTGFITLASERESLRFKPYATYRVSNQSNRSGWDQEVRGGISGPITDYIEVSGDAGYFWNEDPGQSGIVWRARLQHTPRESTRHSIEYRRSTTFPERDLETTLEYRIQQGIGPELMAEAALQRLRFSDLDTSLTGSEEDRIEARVTWNINPRASLRVGLAYGDVDNFAPGSADYQLTTGRIEFRHQTYGTLYTTLVYQYEKRNSALSGDSYYENLFTITLRKTF